MGKSVFVTISASVNFDAFVMHTHANVGEHFDNLFTGRAAAFDDVNWHC